MNCQQCRTLRVPRRRLSQEGRSRAATRNRGFQREIALNPRNRGSCSAGDAYLARRRFRSAAIAEFRPRAGVDARQQRRAQGSEGENALAAKSALARLGRPFAARQRHWPKESSPRPCGGTGPQADPPIRRRRLPGQGAAAGQPPKSPALQRALGAGPGRCTRQTGASTDEGDGRRENPARWGGSILASRVALQVRAGAGSVRGPDTPQGDRPTSYR